VTVTSRHVPPFGLFARTERCFGPDLADPEFQARSMTSPFSYRLEQPADSAAIDTLHAAVFPPDWTKRAAYVLRDGVPPDHMLSHVATVDGKLVASVRMTPITIGGRPALILGPLVVAPGYEGQGAGRTLVRNALDAARAHGHKAVMLVGDLPYYGPLGFEFLGRDVITLPAWVDPDRVLVAALQPDALVGLGGKAERIRGASQNSAPPLP
jgi:predicted N-acetyltransferase YhbS